MDKKTARNTSDFIHDDVILHFRSKFQKKFLSFSLALLFYLRFSVFLLAVSRSERLPTQECISVE